MKLVPGLSVPLILIGGGGHALAVAEAALLSGRPVLGFYDDRADAALGSGPGALRWLGPISPDCVPTDAELVLAVGDLAWRSDLAARWHRARWAGPIRHPWAMCSPTAALGAAVYAGPHSVVHARAEIGEHAIVNSGAIVEHECRVGAFAHIGPGAALGGRVVVGPRTLVGLGSRVLPNVTIGAGATIAAGSVVIRDVPDHATVGGVPARRLGAPRPSGRPAPGSPAR